ncbi:MAG: molybdopterin cofactor-binding domain-containing protein [Sphingomonas sp.]
MLATTATGAGLLLSCFRGPPLADPLPARLSPFLALKTDGTAVFYLPSAEMGQDVYTTLAKIFADEAGLDWPALGIEFAPHARAFYNLTGTQATGGSRTVRQWYQRLRSIGAAVRLAFLKAAAEKLAVPLAELDARDSAVVHRATGTRLSYHALAPLLDGIPLPDAAELRPDAELRLIGRDIPRRDTLAKITGAAQFGADVLMPGQLYAAVAMVPEWVPGIAKVTMPPSLGKGVVGTHRFANAIAVVARSWAAASRAAAQIELTAVPMPGLDNQAIEAELARAITAKPGNLVSRHGDALAGLAHGTRVQAIYDVPYLGHACMETMTATARVGENEAHIVLPTQAPDRTAEIAAEVLGLPAEKVRVDNTFLGGGFGRKGTDFQIVRQAVVLAKKFGRPVQVIWDRETDMRNDLYRPAAKFAFEAALAADGTIAAIRTRGAMQSTRRQRFPKFYKSTAHEAPEDLFPYASQASEHRWIEANLPISVGYWRSIDNSHYPFATECFIDELAHAAGRDPLAFRLAHLPERPRARAVIRAAAEMAGWGSVFAGGSGLGMAMIEAWDSACAQVAKVTMVAGRPRVDKIWAAVDCGLAVSPQGVRDQIESAIVFALTAALQGTTTIGNGQVTESNFHDHPLLTMADMPEIEVRILPSPASPGGVGELGTPPVAPAVANAIFAATGKRVRRLPLLPAFRAA